MAFLQNHSQKSIFLVDDDEDDRLIFTEALSEIDNSVALTEAKDGIQLMDFLYTSKPLPDIIFLDINMPKKSGFECLEEIRNHDSELKDLSVIMLTTCSNPASMEKAFALGATFYAVKPNKFNDLKLLISNVLQMDMFYAGRSEKEFRLI